MRDSYDDWSPERPERPAYRRGERGLDQRMDQWGQPAASWWTVSPALVQVVAVPPRAFAWIRSDVG